MSNFQFVLPKNEMKVYKIFFSCSTRSNEGEHLQPKVPRSAVRKRANVIEDKNVAFVEAAFKSR